MEDDFSGQPGKLSQTHVAILGLGLMGGSLALALRGRCAAILAADPDPDTRRLAVGSQVVDACTGDPAEVLLGADLVVLAAPVSGILKLLGELPALHPGRAVVVDLGSTKTDIAAAMSALPERFAPVGGHPMCGKESGGLANADPQLYRGAPFALTSLPNTTLFARQLVLELVEALGARPLWIDPLTHDRWAAAVSHLPYLLASALALNTPPEAAILAGPGLRSTARLAASPRRIMLDILDANRENILGELGRYRRHLAALEAALAAGDLPGLASLLEQSAAGYEALLKTSPSPGDAHKEALSNAAQLPAGEAEE